jgi:hypothetical protein
MLPADRRFLFIAALPKSASSYAWLVISALQEQSGRANPNRSLGTLPDPFAPLTLGTLERFPQGGVYKSHAPANTSTFEALNSIGCKYVILFRDPADFIPALYCHLKSYPEELEENSLYFEAIFSEIQPAVLQMSLDEAMAYLINNGALRGALAWMTGWTKSRNERISSLVTYEDLVNNFDATLERLSHFVRKEPPSDDITRYLTHVMMSVASEGAAKSASHYPRGWTGTIGVWKQYFSSNNLQDYNRIVERHLAENPDSRYLLSIYPNLVLPRDAGSVVRR